MADSDERMSPDSSTFVTLDESDLLSSKCDYIVHFNQIELTLFYRCVDYDEYESINEHASRKISVQIADKSALQCKNDCEFYGNQEWDGYCSLCYKNLRNSVQSTSVDSIMKSEPKSSSPLSLKKKLLPDVITRAQSASSLTYPASFLSNSSGSFRLKLIFIF